MDNRHETTMSHGQRKMLIHTLSQGPSPHDMRQLAELTDAELHLQWLAECKYTDEKPVLSIE